MFPVLAYHKVDHEPDPREPPSMTISPALFEAQIVALLEGGWAPVPPDLSRIPERGVLITFDDGYLDNHTHALPILKRHGVAALVFLIGDFLPRPDGSSYPPPSQPPVYPMLEMPHIFELADAGWKFGSHSMTHPRLSQLPRETLHTELESSRRLISEVTGQPVNTIAYPFGAWSPAVAAEARRCGYQWGFTIKAGPFSGRDPMAQRRILVGPSDSPSRLLRRLSPLARQSSRFVYGLAGVGSRLSRSRADTQG